MMKEIPCCPKCGKDNVLALVDLRSIICLTSAGGCGQVFPIRSYMDFADLYRTEYEHKESLSNG